MRAALCIRVSPRPQDKVRYSPEIQESKCREWCEANGHEVVAVVQDILVSGGAANRFDSIFAAIDKTPVDILVVSDLSRWTRDDPERFWYIKHVLTERGIRLYSVQEPWLGSDMPFSATITTATVEANARERDTIRRKTGEGVRRAVAAGHVMGLPRLGWTWHADTRTWTQDAELIRAFYADWNDGLPANEIARRYNMDQGSVRRATRARAQRQIVGDEAWLRAQTRAKAVRWGARSDARTGNLFRGMLKCPFCGTTLQHNPHQGYYFCYRKHLSPATHGWYSLTTDKYVIPPVSALLGALSAPTEDVEAVRSLSVPARPAPRDFAGEIDRLSMAWVKGNLSSERYEKALADLREQEARTALPPPTPDEQVEFISSLSVLDLADRSVEGCNLMNRILREAMTLTVGTDRAVTASLNPAYSHWQENRTAHAA